MYYVNENKDAKAHLAFFFIIFFCHSVITYMGQSVFSATTWFRILKSLTILSFLWKCYNLWWLPPGVCEFCSLLAIFLVVPFLAVACTVFGYVGCPAVTGPPMMGTSTSLPYMIKVTTTASAATPGHISTYFVNFLNFLYVLNHRISIQLIRKRDVGRT